MTGSRDPEMDARLRRMFEDGCGTSAMVERTGLGRGAIYQRLSRMGLRRTAPSKRPRKTKTVDQNQCVGPECKRKRWSTDLCETHYRQRKSGQELSVVPLRLRKKTGVKCALAACYRNARCAGLCNMHYQRKRSGDPNWRRPVALRRRGTVRLNGIMVPTEVMAALRKLADGRGVPLGRQAADCIEWFIKDREREERDGL